MNLQKCLLVFISTLYAWTLSAADSSLLDQVVQNVNLQKYQGTWHEIARIENRFQKKCAYGVTANYKVIEGGSLISVENKCYEEDNAEVVANGRARINPKNPKTQGALQVTFVKFARQWIFKFVSGDYWIIKLNNHPKNGYVVIGHPKLKTAWILSRQTTMSKADLLESKKSLEDFGYDPCKLGMTPQKPGQVLDSDLCKYIEGL